MMLGIIIAEWKSIPLPMRLVVCGMAVGTLALFLLEVSLSGGS